MNSEKMIFDLDLEKCVGCFACAAACMDQNDTDVSLEKGFRDVFPVNSAHSASGKPAFLSVACFHCEDAPCVMGCPTGAIIKDPETGMTEARPDLCIGCHSCAMACPYGAPRFGQDGKIRKCGGCQIRVENGLTPACVRVCPTGALRFDTEENLRKEKRGKTFRALLRP